MHRQFRNAVRIAAISLAVNAPVFADASHHHGHESFAAKGEAHPHGTEKGNVRTGDNSIEIYGKLYMSLGYSDPGPGEVEKIDMSSHGSFLGVRGNQPLNDALRLFWQIESAIDLDNLGEGQGHDGGGNGSSLASRDSFVGLSGSAGTLLFGKHFTPLTMVLHANDPFAHLPGDARSMLGYVGHRYQSSIDSGHGTMFYVRAPNSIVYMSPDIGGFSTNLALIAIDESAAHDGVRMPGTSLSLSYKIGSFNASYAFERHKKLDRKTSETPGGDPSRLDMTQVHMLTAMYHFPTSTMVNFTVQKLEAKDSVDENGEGADGDHDRTAYHVSVQQKFGPHSLRASYTQTSDFGNHASGDNDSGQMIALGWFQALSSNTEAYVAVASTKNDKRGDYGTFFVGEVEERDADPTTFAMGLIHSF